MIQETTCDGFIALLRNRSRGARRPLFFGQWFSATHVVVVEDGVWRIRRAVFERARADANYAACGMYMPEPGEFEYRPGPEVVLEAASMDELIAAVKSVPWPLP
ncbi:hypothetical protein OV203_08545 [Nannocystis sp. ILAH1]|uniref:hypothetical protein n=1 Tax=unclassified Nannocystis TaxID=2627009 RepID=UPI0022722B05|nr:MULTISPECIES: hypothetical protein [unclassified Nannocystis]MCY0987170.1 hypothetical protein [Nannocystis sp. ILAH1]MCY1072053.1 hypothetical protein [Nannocystis sp. RBIL2]